MGVIAKHSMFDGLFAVALKPTGAFAEKLKAAGFDPARPQAEYPLPVWYACVDVAARELYPQESRERAWWLLGRRFIEGYLQTLVGRLIAVSLPFLSAKSFAAKAPRFMSTGLGGCETVLDWKSDRALVLRMPNLPPPSAHLLAGTVEVCFERLGTKGLQLEAVSSDPESCELRMAWD